MSAKDEPSNPFKNPRKAPSEKPKSPHIGRKGGKGRSHAGPPAPPGKKVNSPPVAPSGTKSKPTNHNDSVKTPAKAGKSVGLRKKSDAPQTEAQRKTDERARELIEATRVKATESQTQKEESMQKKKEPNNPFKKSPKTNAPPRKSGRFGRKNRPQGPTKRVQKLHRGKYMEFKYDVRRILEDENVEDEHRSNVLGQTWAKGERQGVAEAKLFLEEKVSSGVISESCSTKISKLIDSLTTRR